MLGTELISDTADGNDHIKRLTRALEFSCQQSSPRRHWPIFANFLPASPCADRGSPPQLPEHSTHNYRSSTHSCSVKFSNVNNTNGSSERLNADLLTLARTVQPS